MAAKCSTKNHSEGLSCLSEAISLRTLEAEPRSQLNLQSANIHSTHNGGCNI